MGQIPSIFVEPKPTATENPPAERWNPKTVPDWNNDPIFPPNYGFEEKGLKRKERVMIATPLELHSAHVIRKYRDFCAHKYITYINCARRAYPMPYQCHHEVHDWKACMEEDYTISIKEYERERRLMLRKNRKDRLIELRKEREEYLANNPHHHQPETAAA